MTSSWGMIFFPFLFKSFSVRWRRPGAGCLGGGSVGGRREARTDSRGEPRPGGRAVWNAPRARRRTHASNRQTLCWAGLQPSSATVSLSHIAPASASSHQLSNSIFLSHHSSSSLPNAVKVDRRQTMRATRLELQGPRDDLRCRIPESSRPLPGSAALPPS